MNKLFILTSCFPYEGGEQFLETEIEFWNDTKFDDIFIVPASSNGKPRFIPNNIKVIERKSTGSKTKYVMLALTHSILFKELSYLIKDMDIKDIPFCLNSIIKNTAVLIREIEYLKLVLQPYKESDITIYSYWNDISSYAACILKRQGIVSKVVSRAHGFDLYKERRPAKYMPLKRQFVKDYDRIFLLSNSSFKYYHDNYNANYQNLDIAKLGVEIPSKISHISSEANVLKLLSLSYCVPIKQIDLIMDAIESYAYQNPTKPIVWTHIGDGSLFNSLEAKARSLISLYPNLKINFTGYLDNSKVKSHLATTKYDVMINASKSEGVPVSIMEAMSFGIPVIAPDIGGISDLVNNTNGFLMPSICNKEDIIKGIEYICNTDAALSENAHLCVTRNFNSSINFPDFINRIEGISGLHKNR